MPANKDLESESDKDKPIHAGSLDLSKRSSWSLLRQAADNGWNIPTDYKDKAVKAVMLGLNEAIKKKSTRGINSAVRTLAALHGHDQAVTMQAIKIAADAEARDRDLPDESAAIKVMFPTRGPQSAGPAADDDDREAGDG